MKWFAVVFIVLLACAIEFTRVYAETRAIEVKDQAFGEIVTVDRVTVFKRGKLVVVTSRYGRPTDDVVGTSTLLQPGIYRGIDIELPTLADPASHDIKPGDEVVAVLYSLTNRHATVAPQKTLFGGRIMQKFRLL